MHTAQLQIISGPRANETFVLTADEVIIGREVDCQLVLRDPQVSRRHASLSRRSEGYFLQDLQSSNGTVVNGKPLLQTGALLNRGDEIIIGASAMVFGLTDEAETDDDFAAEETLVQRLDPGDLALLSSPGQRIDDADDETSALRLLLDLAHEVEKSADLTAIANLLADGLGRAVSADRVFLFVGHDAALHGAGDMVCHRAAAHQKKIYALPVARSLLSRAAEGKNSVLGNLGTETAPAESTNSRARSRSPIVSVIAVPLFAGDEYLGALYLDRLSQGGKHPGSFTGTHLELATAAGLQCALAVLNLRRLQELRASRDTLETELSGGRDGFIGTAPCMRQVYNLIDRVAPTAASVLITGESGTGKELVARAIHRQSPRAERPLVIVNCAALAESLAEAELFGHERGAFTGADKARPGKFAAADGGTIFLDEIGELPEAVQAKLLRVLEAGEITAVGEAAVRKIDVRVIAATNRDLAAEVANGHFRSDLFYRLNVFSVALPPLRDRREDIPALLEYFVRFIGERCGRPRLRMPSAVSARCLDYHWPGNVRELRNAVERIVILSRGNVLSVDDLPAEIAGVSYRLSQPDTVALGGSGSLDSGWRRSLAEVEAAHIKCVLEKVGGNKSQAAAILGIDRSTLYKR